MGPKTKGARRIYGALTAAALGLLWITVALGQEAAFLALLAASGAAVAAPNAAPLCSWLRSRASAARRIRAGPARSALDLPLAKSMPVAKISQKISSSLETDIPTAGVAMDPYLEGIKGATRALLLAAAAAPCAALLLAYSGDPATLLLLAAPAAAFAWPKVRLRLLASERREQANDELAFFAAYASIMQAVGRPMHDILDSMRGRRLLPCIEREAEMIRRDSSFFPENPLDAINRRALAHPNQLFRNLLVGYVSIQKDGGDLTHYLERAAEDLFLQLRSRFHRYEEQAKNFAILANSLFSILPIFLVAGMFIMTAESVSSLVAIIFVMLPVCGAMIYAAAGAGQPRHADGSKFHMLGLPAGAAGAAAGYAALGEAWAAIALGALLLSASNAALCARAHAEARQTDSALGDFLRDVTESKKIGNPISVAVARLASERSYNAHFDRLLLSAAASLRFGAPLSAFAQDAGGPGAARIRSWLGRMAFFILGRMEDSGGGSAQSLEALTRYMTRIKSTRKELSSALQIFWLLAYANPFIMVYISGMLAGWLEAGAAEDSLASDYLPFEILSSSPEFIGTVHSMIAFSSIGLGVIMTKVVNFAISKTSNLAVLSGLTLAAILAEPYYPRF